jgi:UDP-N-acetylglucosamine acyltransferase
MMMSNRSSVLLPPSRIHPTAVVDPDAVLGEQVEVGPYAVIGPDVVLGPRVRIGAHVVVEGPVVLGADCRVHPGAVIGGPAQIRGQHGEGGGVVVGERTVLREHVTVHRAERPGTHTVVGADCLVLVGAHVAHDCVIGDAVTLANGALLAGDVVVGTGAFISGHVVVHQHVRIGGHAMVGGLARIGKDIPPYLLATGRNAVRGINVVGLRRAGFASHERQTIRQAYRAMYGTTFTRARALAALGALGPSAIVDEYLAFINASRRGICPGPRRRRATPDEPSAV